MSSSDNTRVGPIATSPIPCPPVEQMRTLTIAKSSWFKKSTRPALTLSKQEEGLIEELAIQLYRPTLAALNGELKEKTLLRARDRIPTAIGLFTGYRSSPWAASVIREQTELVKRKHFAGVAYFFYETLVNQRIDPGLGNPIARSRSDLDFFV